MLGLRRGAGASRASPAMAADAITLQLKWVTQAQFGGYYVAKDKGFYEEENLDVTINPGGPDIAPEQVIAGGGADVIVDWMAGGARGAREGREARQHRPAVQEVRPDDDLPEGDRHHLGSRFQGQDARRLVLRQRVSVLRLDEQDRHADRRRGRRRHGAEAELRRAAADPEAGRLHLGDDLQRVRPGARRRLQAGRPHHLQLHRHGQRPARGRSLRARGQARRTRPSSTRWCASSAPR